MNQKIKDYKDLIVWQKSRELVRHIYQLTKKLPDTEKFGLVTQLQRASISIPANIAEGYSRGSRKEYGQFLSIATGSASELETLIILAADVNLIKDREYDAVLKLLTEIRRMLTSLRNKIRET